MRALALALMALLAAACAPRILPPGPPVTTPHLTADAFVTADGRLLPRCSWKPDTPPRAVIVAAHGFNDHAGAFAPPAPGFTDHGIALYAYDQRGFGRARPRGLWPGDDALIDDFATFARLIAAQNPGAPLFLMGESMGGAVALGAATQPDPPPHEGVILIAPAVWGLSTMHWAPRLGLTTSAHTVPWLKVSPRGLDITPSDNRSMLRRLSKDWRVIKHTRLDALWGLAHLMDRAQAAAGRLDRPTLVLYGAREDILPADPIADFVADLPRDLPGLWVAAYPRGYHMLLRDLNAEVVLADIRAWLADPAAPLPSGAMVANAGILRQRLTDPPDVVEDSGIARRDEARRTSAECRP